MAKYIRYALATICFAASVGCLALWWRSYELSDRFGVTLPGIQTREFAAWTYDGDVILGSQEVLSPFLPVGPRWTRPMFPGFVSTMFDEDMARQGQFGSISSLGPYFPLWYPALIFALAGVAALRFRRQFSIRSALIAVSVVVALLGMAVAL